MAACKDCEEPLLLEVEDDETGQTQSIPDDLELPCGCHYHWQCLLDQAAEVAMSLKCPACQSQIAANSAGPSVTNPFLHTTPSAKILTRYHNEGGLQESLDILPSITEEAYLAANPEARPARAYHVMCSEGDVGGIVELLRDVEQGDGDEPSMNPMQLLRYQDPLSGSKSGLHLAVEKAQEEVLWLLLWLASPLPTDVFPAAAVEAAQSMGLQRPSTGRADDIRLLQDDRGRTAESIATEMDGIWSMVVQAGALHPGV
ncbi:hypothetical protein JX265_002783 [Neoarthrinium moseri]|uniref:Uncharacterized protein n=1 Tax=Neoarthrinium moseri TaxID=1658444 RepID=A0A9Q0ASM7_9PEZI|nr:uncharacterized protein JN550_010122 [Neoarthrinium moseri]KAI1845132.1 hypothetical protein JX266_008679 [Neoarthrinium moseri]KAI1862597.1 hypothetical protein JN550_010122 [Neoarthrinium moseri]KAI1878606.1 hypothetical protein JX265_002783 [Neoarthrinium moseri]